MFRHLKTRSEILRAFKKTKRTRTKIEQALDTDVRVGFFIMLVAMVFFAFMSFRFTKAFLSDSAVSANNTFSAAEVFPTPTPTPTPGPGDVVINEILWMGSSLNASDEWIELRNMTSNTIDLSNWVVDNLGSGVTNNIVIPAGKNISSNGFFLIANDPKETSRINVDPDHQVNISLQNTPGEQLILRSSAGGTIIDTADNDGGSWFAGEDNPEKSMERNAVPGDGTVSSNWHTASSAANLDPDIVDLATPKTTNSSGL